MYGQPVGKINGTTYQPTNQPSSPGRYWQILTPCCAPKAPKTRSPRRWMHSAPRKPTKKWCPNKNNCHFLSARKVCRKKSGGKQQKSMAKFVWMIFVCFRTWSIDCVILKNCHCGCESLHWILWMVDCHGWMFFDGCVSALKRENIIWWFVPWRPWINLPFEYPLYQVGVKLSRFVDTVFTGSGWRMPGMQVEDNVNNGSFRIGRS